MMKIIKDRSTIVTFISILLLCLAFTSISFADGGLTDLKGIQSIEQLSHRILNKTQNVATLRSFGNRHASKFVQVKGSRFILRGKPYYYIGANFWHAMNLASKGAGGNREQFIRELDMLKAKGITNLRIICASEGPNTEPYRIVPALMPEPDVYDPELLDGLDFALKAMGDRDMKAIMVLGNMWHWSGGFGQHLVWSGYADAIPYPPPHPDGDWDVYQYFVANFYGDLPSVVRVLKHIAFLTSRYNGYTQKQYREDPAIMAWELANEPRGMDQAGNYLTWVKISSAFIKLCDPNHLVTIGSEGITPWPETIGTEYIEAHGLDTIDYTTAHVWVQNWGWFDPYNAEETYEPALQNALDYINLHFEKIAETGKPLVLEEFGIARDNNSYDPNSAVTWRDMYYTSIFEHLYQAAASGTGIAGANFWAWSGEARPVEPYGSFWQAGDPLLGDPPHENQGWYGIYDSDISTLSIIKAYAQKMTALSSLIE